MITHQQFSDNVQTASYFQNGKNPTSTPHCLAIFTDSVLDGTAKAFHNGRSGTISMDSGELSSVMSVSVDGTDQLTCSTAPKCLTVAYAARKITNGGTIHVEQGTFGSNGQEDGILVETREIGLSGAGKDKTKVILTQKEGTDANFFISTGSLSLSSLALKLPSAPATTVLGLIAVDGQGELSIEFCELSGNADQQTTILVSAINGAVVRIVSSSFRDLEGLGSGGCCVDVVLGGVGSVNITSCDFSGVTTTQTTDYTASLIRIELTENTQSFCLASLVFDPSIPLFPASHIHILAPDVTQCITPSQFSLDFEDTAEDNQRFVATSEEPFRSKESFGIPWYFESLITLYMDSNGDDTNACDTAVTACRTLQRAAEIMGGLTNFTVRVKSGAVAGSVDVTDATIVSSSTSELAAVQATAESDAVPLLSVDGGRLVCTRLDISVQPTSQNDFVLLRGVNSADIQLTHCVLHCESLFVSEDAAVDICSWETGAVAVVDSSLDLSDTTLSSFSQGALFLEDSSLSLSNTQFEGNSPSNEKYTQARRNMVCSNSSIAMGEGVVFADNTKDTPLCMWITGNECKVSTNGSVSTNHLLFQLQIDSKLNVSLNDTNLIVNVTGKNIFPCNVVLTIVPNKTASNRDTIRIPLQEDGDVEGISDLTLTDTSISFQISSIYVPWREEQSYFQILVDGESIQTFEAFYKFVSMPTSSLLQWILLGVAVGVGLVLVCIATIFLVRHAAKRAARLQSRRRVMSEEMDAIGTNLTQHTLTKFSSLPPAPPAFCPVLVLPGQDEKEVLGEWDVPCVLCDDAEFRWCYGDSRRSVFSQLHSIEGGKDDILDSNGQKEQISGFSPVETVSILLKVVAALKFLLASPSKHDSSLFTPASLSSHSILVFPNGQVCLALPQPLAESVGLKNPNAIHRQNNVFFSDSISNRRWFSPELATPSTVLNAPEVAQSLVFSLGLVLFEMVVGEVPFGQLDGIQAQRKIQIGLLPDLKLITHGKKKTADKTFNAIRDKHELEQTVKDEDTEAAIERAVVLEEMCAKCLRFGGKDRPQLTQLKEQLELLV
ncbi:hypothetical protein BLNAU_7656 [Blattamonas nauphoetae]|uniref:Protein kinase domain-containing protein n=1 Tax=Blattamonas nauphoetae TaxID=2049346 RepID=A0ABQ9Y0N5_9EUKA|nr:hypothetical protein BLNAU_7656 [Blattamonas nauphoetae]